MTIAFVGGGNMASALIGGMIARGRDACDMLVVEPLAIQRTVLAERFPGASLAAFADELPAIGTAQLIVLAVKPQQMRDALRPLVPFLVASGQPAGQPIVLSIAAGLRLQDIGRWLGGYTRLVRAMPNTPALIGQGITGVYAAATVDAGGRALIGDVLGASGEIVWVDDEAMLDAVTGVSGSGPAYVFYFLEALERAAGELGFAPETARALAYRTFAGAIALAQQSDQSPAVLRAQVTSKGGTTERAILHMQNARVDASIVDAVKAAAERARELGDVLGRD